MEIKTVKFRENGFYSRPFAFGGEGGKNKFNKGHPDAEDLKAVRDFTREVIV